MAIKRGAGRAKRRGDGHIALKYFAAGTQIISDGLTIQEFPRHAKRVGLRVTPEVYYKSRELAKLFAGDRSGLVRLCRWRKGHRRVSWTHLIELMAEPDPGRREEYAAFAVAENLGGVALREIIRGSGNLPNRRPGDGPKRRAPRNTAEGVWRAGRDINRVTATLEWLKTKELKRPLRAKVSKAVAALESLLDTLDQAFAGTLSWGTDDPT